MTTQTKVDRRHNGRLLAALVGLSAALGACQQTTEIVTATVPTDYRLRHPIAVQEGSHSIVVFVGNARGGLSAPQRNDVMGLAQTWVREGTGGIIADVPVNTQNARAASATYREIRSVLAAGGVPSNAIMLRQYQPEDGRILPTIKLSYPKIAATAGPCGLWPEDLGPSLQDTGYNENRPYHNFGCATQRNLCLLYTSDAADE